MAKRTAQTSTKTKSTVKAAVVISVVASAAVIAGIAMAIVGGIGTIRRCVNPTNGMQITSDTVICKGTWNLPSGMSIVKSNVNLSCQPGTVIRGSSAGYAVLAMGKNYDKLENVSVSGCRFDDYKSGIGFYWTINGSISGNTITNMDANSIAAGGTDSRSPYTNTNLTIENNIIGGETANGLNLGYAENAFISGNEIGCTHKLSGRIVLESKAYKAINISKSAGYTLNRNTCAKGSGSSDLCASECVSAKCSDSDGGKSYYDKGIADSRLNGIGSYFEDVCLSKDQINSSAWQYNEVEACSGDNCYLQEGLCKDDSVSNIAYSCQNGCENGMCFYQKIAGIMGAKNQYKPSETMELTVKGVEIDGTSASQQEGWNIQYYIYDASNSSSYLQENSSLGYNAKFSDEYWHISNKAPQRAGDYFMTVTLYCSRENSKCWKITNGEGMGQIEKIYFKVAETETECYGFEEKPPTTSHNCCAGLHMVYNLDFAVGTNNYPICCDENNPCATDGICRPIGYRYGNSVCSAGGIWAITPLLGRGESMYASTVSEVRCQNGLEAKLALSNIYVTPGIGAAVESRSDGKKLYGCCDVNMCFQREGLCATKGTSILNTQDFFYCHEGLWFRALGNLSDDLPPRFGAY